MSQNNWIGYEVWILTQFSRSVLTQSGNRKVLVISKVSKTLVAARHGIPIAIWDTEVTVC